MAGLPVIETRWFKISVTLNTEEIVLDIVNYLKENMFQHYFGSLVLKLTSSQYDDMMKQKFAPYIVLTPQNQQRPDASIVCEDKWDLDTKLYQEALVKRSADEESDDAFYQQFTALFELDKRGALKIDKSKYANVQLFAVRFAHKIKSNSGLDCVVPRLHKEHQSQNKIEMFRMFISVYPAYCHLVKNLGWTNAFYWKYTIDEA